MLERCLPSGRHPCQPHTARTQAFVAPGAHAHEPLRQPSSSWAAAATATPCCLCKRAHCSCLLLTCPLAPTCALGLWAPPSPPVICIHSPYTQACHNIHEYSVPPHLEWLLPNSASSHCCAAAAAAAAPSLRPANRGLSRRLELSAVTTRCRVSENTSSGPPVAVGQAGGRAGLAALMSA